MMEQITKEQAINIAEKGLWKEWSKYKRAEFQLLQDFLCMPFDVFHEAMEKRLKRPVFTHEFAFRDGLIREMFDGGRKPTLREIIELIPEEKRIILVLDKKEAQ